MTEQNKTGLQINYWFLVVAAGLMLMAGAVALIFFLRTNFLANKKIAEAAETSRPANLDLVIISDKSCAGCFDVTGIINQIKQQNVKIGSERSLDKESDEGKELIKKFAVARLPTFIASGELQKDQILKDFFSQAGDTVDGNFIFREVGPPYTLVESGVIKGRVQLDLIVDSSCTECYDVTRHEGALAQLGVNILGTVIDSKSAAGRRLISKYGIKLLPTFVLSGEVSEYPDLKSIWPKVGTIAPDGAYVFTNVELMGTYKNLSTNQVITPPVPTSTAQ